MQFQHPPRRSILPKWFPRTPHVAKEPSRRNAGEETTSRKGTPIGGTTGQAFGGATRRYGESTGGCPRVDRHHRKGGGAISGVCATQAGVEIVPGDATRIAHEEFDCPIRSM